MPSKPPTFRPKGSRTRQQANAQYDARRGSSVQRGYNTDWAKRAAAFKQDNPYCLGCQAVGTLRTTDAVDHVIPHKGNQSLMWDITNLQPACRFHHDVVKQRLERMFLHGEIKSIDLRLDSLVAKRITTDLLGGG